MQANAMEKASDDNGMLLQSQMERLDLIQRQKEARDLTAPYLSLGTESANRLNRELNQPSGALYGTPEFNAPRFSFTEQDLYSDPSYAFRKNEGINAVNASNSASGLFGSGRGYNALLERGQDMASQEYGNAWNRAMGKYGTDYNATLGEYTAKSNNQANLYNRLMGGTGVGANTALNLSNIVNGLQGNIANLGMQGQQLDYTAGMNSANMKANALQGMSNNLQSGLGMYMKYRDNQNMMNALNGGGQTGAYYGGMGQAGVGYQPGYEWTAGLGF
jgi:hypothetical protein